MEPIVTIIIPVVRPDKAERCIAAIKENSGVEDGEYYIDIRTDDNGIGCPEMVELMVNQVTTSLVMFLGDDTIPQKDFLKNALIAKEKMGKPGLIGLNDGTRNGETFATHWLASMAFRELLPDRQFFHTSYNHCFCDYELTDIAKENDCYVFCPQAEVAHDHPIFNYGEGNDKFYERVYAPDVYMEDRENFWKRKRDRLTSGDLLDRPAIAEPNISGKVDREYHHSFIIMEKPSVFHLLYPDRDVMDFTEDWSRIRNNLMIQGMNDGCTCIAMLDTDQEYAPDVLMKLLHNPAWKHPDTAIVGGLVFKRHKPYDPAIRRMENDLYYLPEKKEIESRKTIEVDAIGAGCMVIKTDVLLGAQSIYPWFKEVMSNKGRRISEDFNFCFKLRRMGYRIYCDTSTEITHWTRMGVNRYTSEIIQKFK